MLAAATSALTLGAASPAFGQCSCMPADPCPAGCVGASVGMDYHACKPGTTFVAGQINWPVVAGEQVQYAVQLSRPSPGMECNFHNGQVRLFFPGIAVLRLVGARWVLRLAALVFFGGGLAAFGISSGRATEKTGRGTDPDLRTARIVLAASAMALLRGSVGFLTFLVAFAFRHSHAPSWWFGVVLLASMGGSLIGTAVAPGLRRLVSEERILLGALVLVTVVGLFASRAGGRPWAAGMAAAVAIAATAGKLAFDSLVQRDAPDAARGRSFARFETRFQLSWVVGALIPVVVPVPSRLGYLVLAVVALFAAASYVAGRRAVRRAPPAPA